MTVHVYNSLRINCSTYILDRSKDFTRRQPGLKHRSHSTGQRYRSLFYQLVTDLNNSPRSKTAFWIVIRARRHFWACLFICCDLRFRPAAHRQVKQFSSLHSWPRVNPFVVVLQTRTSFRRSNKLKSRGKQFCFREFLCLPRKRLEKHWNSSKYLTFFIF